MLKMTFLDCVWGYAAPKRWLKYTPINRQPTNDQPQLLQPSAKKLQLPASLLTKQLCPYAKVNKPSSSTGC